MYRQALVRAAGKSKDCGRAGPGRAGPSRVGLELGQVLRQRGKLFSQRAAGVREKDVLMDGRKFSQYGWEAEEEAACRCLRLNDVNCSQTAAPATETATTAAATTTSTTATTTATSRDKENSEAAN